jgi:dihydroorotate dehydrogenase (NAD+) catalytic subunit
MSPTPDLSVHVAGVALDSPIVAAAGTSGHGAELGAYLDLSKIGAVTVKSLSADPWPGNPAPRVTPVRGGMLNSVGLQGPGVARWREEELPELAASGAKVIVSVWGRTVADFARAAELLCGLGPEVIALEVNISCPNTEDRRRMFAQSPTATAEAIDACAAAGLPRWAKLTPAVASIVEIAAAARDAGAAAVTLTNTALGLAIDLEHRRPMLGGVGGGLSGPALHAIAVRSVFECFQAMPELPIVGVGGVTTGEDAIEMMMAGASCVGVGTATLARPRAIAAITRQLVRWCDHHGVSTVAELTGAAHG